MSERCKNKKCQKLLPEDYKYKYCEHCRNKHADTVKNVIRAAGGVAAFALVVVIGGKFKPKSK